MASDIAIVVGLTAEARIARRLGCPVGVGGGTEAGAALAADRLLDAGASALVSFGLAGGLDPALRPGDMVIPATVLTKDATFATNADLSGRFGGPTAHGLWGGDRVAATAAEKQALHRESGAAAIDLESGAVARSAHARGVPFAVVRAICDPAERDLPPAALVALGSAGGIGLMRVLASILCHPAQLPALLTLGSDAARARRALLSGVRSSRLVRRSGDG